MSPIETLLASAITVLVGVIRWLYTDQKKSAATERMETRKQIEHLTTHIEDCNADRVKFSTEIATLKERQKNLENCPRPDCPHRRSASSLKT